MQSRYLHLLRIVLLLLVSLSFTIPPVHAQDEVVPADSVQSAAATEILVYDINRPLTKQDRGFPRDQPPRSSANGNWKSPVNFADGTIHYRVEIRQQPRAQTMRLQFCVWQDGLRLENCGLQQRLVGNPNTVVTWSQPVKAMWKKNGKSIDWARPRQRYGIAIKNAQGKPVSDLVGWNWNGENPDLWYPLNMRFTVVVVAKGARFSGWQRYTGGSSASASEVVSADANIGSTLTVEGAAQQDREHQALEHQLYLPLIVTQ